MTDDRQLREVPTSEPRPVSLVNPFERAMSTEPEPAPSLGDDLLPTAPAGWTDVLTGTDGPRYWDRVMTTEQARIRRYRRPATVALAEIAGLDALARRWGGEVAERTFVKLARALAGEVRSSDYIARVDRTRFAVLLTETNEIAAINFVERARATCEEQLGLARDDIRLGLGWASPPDQGDLSDAFETALARLAEDLARPT